MEKGALRQFVDNNVVYQLKKCVDKKMECQYININYKKGGEVRTNIVAALMVVELAEAYNKFASSLSRSCSKMLLSMLMRCWIGGMKY